MSEHVSIWTVDRIEGELAVVLSERSQTSLEVFRHSLPGLVREGDVLLVPTSPSGAPDWESAVMDEELRYRRNEEAHQAVGRAPERDPGGVLRL